MDEHNDEDVRDMIFVHLFFVLSFVVVYFDIAYYLYILITSFVIASPLIAFLLWIFGYKDFAKKILYYVFCFVTTYFTFGILVVILKGYTLQVWASNYFKNAG